MINLLAATGQGDEQAFETLYRRTSPRLFSVCLQVLQRRDLAEEVVQDAYVRICHNAGEYHPGRGSPLGWMCSIARYRAIDVARAQRARPRGGEELLEQLPDDGSGPLDLAEMAGDRHLLARCMELLTADQRRSIVLAFLQGLTHEELGQRLDRPLGTVKSWICRSLASLRRCLQG